MCPTLFYLNFFEIRLTRGDVWAKTEVLVIGAFLCCILGSYLIPKPLIEKKMRENLCDILGSKIIDKIQKLKIVQFLSF